MAQVIPQVISTLGKYWVSTLTFVASVGTAIYSGAQARKAAKEARQSAGGRKIMVRDSVAPHDLVYGLCRKSGPIVFLQSTGTDNEFLNVVIILASRKVHRIPAVYLDDDLAWVDGQGVSSKYTGFLNVSGHLGETTQVADSNLVTWSGGVWTSNHRLRGRAYLAVRLKWDADRFPTGLPNIAADVMGHEIFDPVSETNTYSANPARIAADYLNWSRHKVPYSKIHEDEFTAASATCDEELGLNEDNAITLSGDTTSGSLILQMNSPLVFGQIRKGMVVQGTGIPNDTSVVGVIPHFDQVVMTQNATASNNGVSLSFGFGERRYSFNGVISSASTGEEALNAIKRTMAGYVFQSGGLFYIRAGEYRVPTVSIDESHFRGDINGVLARASKTNLINRVRGTRMSPEEGWNEVDFTPVKNATYLGWDNGTPLWLDLDFPDTISDASAQRLAKIELEKNRQQIRVPITVSEEVGMVCVPGDVVELSLERMGWEEKEFEVLSMTQPFSPNESGGLRLVVDMIIQETAAAVWDWNDGEETAYDLAPDTNLPDPFTAQPPSNLAAASGTNELIVTSAGVVISRVKLTWDPPNDIFVLSGGSIEIEYKKSADATWLSATRSHPGNATIFYLSPVEDGVDYDFRIRSRNGLGVRSDWVSLSDETVVGKTAAPDPPTDLTVEAGPEELRISWTNPLDLDLSEIEVSVNTSNDYNTALRNLVDATSYAWRGLPESLHYVWIRAIDTTGNLSSIVGPVTATPTAPAAGLVVLVPSAVLSADEDGVVNDFSQSFVTPVVLVGTNTKTYNGTPTNGTWRYGTFTPTNCTRDTGTTLPEIGIDAMSADDAQLSFEVIYRDSSGSDSTVTATIYYAKARKGVKGDTGATGAAGDDGDTGPGLVFQGAYNGGSTYYHSAIRRDIVEFESNYYITDNEAKDGLATWGEPDVVDWAFFASTFVSVATKLLLAENATILKTLVMGDGTADAGVIRSNGASAFLTGYGFWLGFDGTTAKFRVGDPSGDYFAADGTNITLKRTIKAKTSDYNITVNESGETFVNTGATGLVSFNNSGVRPDMTASTRWKVFQES